MILLKPLHKTVVDQKKRVPVSRRYQRTKGFCCISSEKLANSTEDVLLYGNKAVQQLEREEEEERKLSKSATRLLSG